MRQAIVTKYYGPTNSKGARIKASCEAGSIWFGYASRHTSDKNHALAVLKLIKKLEWKGNYTIAGLPNSTGCVAVDHSGSWDNGQEVTVDSGIGPCLTFRDLENS